MSGGHEFYRNPGTAGLWRFGPYNNLARGGLTRLRELDLIIDYADACGCSKDCWSWSHVGVPCRQRNTQGES